jgi:hypothetical protein
LNRKYIFWTFMATMEMAAISKMSNPKCTYTNQRWIFFFYFPTKFLQFKGVGLGYGRQLYFHCLLKFMVICAFENPP